MSIILMYLSAANTFVVVFLVFDLRHRDHVSPNLMQIHWLPVRSRVQFKLCIMVHAIHNKRSPSPISRRCTDCGNSNYFFFCNLITRCDLHHYGLCRAVDTFQNGRAGLPVCRSRCLEPPSRAHSSPVHTRNL